MSGVKHSTPMPPHGPGRGLLGGSLYLRAKAPTDFSPTKGRSTEIRPTEPKTCLGCGAKFTTIPKGGLPCGH
jgi:hypothetical protein